MHICFMRIFKKPMKFAKLLAKSSKFHGIELVYAHPEDVDMETETIHGKVLVDDRWIDKEIPIPPYIDLNTYCFRYKEVIKFLNERSYISCNGSFGGKEKVYTMLKNDGEFADLLIPSKRTSTFDVFIDYLKKHEAVILKPRHGQKGRGIYKVEKGEANFYLSFENEEKKCTEEELQSILENEIQLDKYVCQKYIDSKTKNGEPFDCRLRLEKDGKGEWTVTNYLIRIGSNQKVVANVSQGGSVCKLHSFLKANYENWQEVKDTIVEIGKTLPYKMEQLYGIRNSNMGIDLGIDSTGKPYLFEVNASPGNEFGEGEIAYIKPDFYTYILKQLAANKVS
ncbi:YheC/YheD family protein [Thalassobacillus hwangdonensis]|uniref:YheC/YheD family protein n=1 Tax=Thalassobacillus hwangdonensis TaxID=546108 RepID=A0ABW3L6D3_9BACI